MKYGKKHSVMGLLPLFQLLDEQGIDTRALLDRHQLDIEKLSAMAVISQEKELAIIQDAMLLADDPILGLKTGDAVNLSSYGVFALLVMSAANVREACNTGAQLQGLSFAVSNITFHYFDDYFEYRLTPPAVSEELKNFVVDRDMAGSMVFTNALTGEEVDVSMCGLARPKPKQNELVHYYSRFGKKVTFGHTYSWIRVSSDRLSFPMPHANKFAHATYKAQCQELLSKMYPDAEDIVGQALHILEGYEGELPSMEQLAGFFSLTERTFSRKLSDAGTSYRKLVDEIKQAKAIDMLMVQNLPVNVIAERLGYSESVSFLTAFRRWTGTSPKKYKQSKLDK